MDIKILPARIEDMALQCERTNSPKFLGFLSANEAAVASLSLKANIKHKLFGGFDGAERTMLCLLPDWCDEPMFPITAITFVYRKCDNLSHRDFLGALMALGINRETVGDILIEQGRAVVFALDDIADFIMSQADKIGSVGVRTQKGYDLPLPGASKTEEHTDTVASLRLDCVVASICNCSRNMALQAISDGRVAVNSICALKSTVNIKCGDVITVRKSGRFKIMSCGEYSKKGRTILRYNKYI